MEFQREIERKFIVEGASSYEWVDNFVSTLPLISKTIAKDTSFDLYWKDKNVDFIRLRENTHELTVKVTDKSNIIDRIEENVKIADEYFPNTKRLLQLLYGPPCLKITKTFSVYEVKYSPAPGTEYKAILCIYKVKEDKDNRIFLEVEADNIEVVDYFSRCFDKQMFLTPEMRSLYQIFVGEAK